MDNTNKIREKLIKEIVKLQVEYKIPNKRMNKLTELFFIWTGKITEACIRKAIAEIKKEK